MLFFGSSGRGVRVHAGRSEGGRKPLRCRGFSGSVVADSGSAAGSRSRIGEEGDALVLIASIGIHNNPARSEILKSGVSKIPDFPLEAFRGLLSVRSTDLINKHHSRFSVVPRCNCSMNGVESARVTSATGEGARGTEGRGGRKSVRGVVVRAPFWEPLPKKRKNMRLSPHPKHDVSSIPSQQHAHDVRAPVLQPRPFLQQTADCTGVGA